MKKFFFFLLLLPFFSFKPSVNDTDVFFGDSITFGNELWPNQYTERWSTKYAQAMSVSEYNYARSGATMTPGLNAGRPVFDIAEVPVYSSAYKNIFVSYWVNDFLYGGTPTAFASSTSTAVDGIIAKGWPASKIVLCFNYLPESAGTWVNLTHQVAMQWLSALRSVQQMKGTSFLDFYTPIYNRSDKGSYTTDLIHPTASWNTVMKELAVTNIEAPGVPLPASLVNFSGVRQGNQNLIKWMVAQESNIARYEIERSSNGSHWLKVGEVSAIGNSSIQRSYNFTDNSFTGVKQLYRLRMVDKNGGVKLSNLIIISGSRSSKMTLSELFPNPASTHLNLIVDMPAKDNVNIQLVDAGARVVTTQNKVVEAGINTLDLNIGSLKAGGYFVKLVSTTHQAVIIGKFVKE